ncbi:unnamed protein product [Rhizoctonia solani]|uniref:Fungal-specific transcription factor domain protein n=1 Tax=Rhizoctonia solani TaxID=456999 RepID=A0A8H3AY66_9AGAM|nr:unnamed protein product [Rhizoctonia solani]
MSDLWEILTKPAPRNAYASGTTAVLIAPISFPGANSTSSSSIASNSRPVKKPYFDSRPVVSWGAGNPISGLAAPAQLSSGINLRPFSHLSFDFFRQPVGSLQAYGTVYATSNPSTQTPELYDDKPNDTDAEEIRVLLYASPTVDKNVKDNTLSFVLQCYSQWATVSVFEPRKVACIMRDQVIDRFSSENSRIQTILIANVMDIYARNLVLDDAGTYMLNRLALAIQKSMSHFMSTPRALDPALDRQNATLILDSVLEIFSLQTRTQPISHCVQSLHCVAPVFRRACPDPPGQAVNLANIMLESNLNLRHFVHIEVMTSMITGQPAHIQYEVPFSLELCERMYQVTDSCSLQWLYGAPDQFIVLFAFINSLCQTPGAGENLGLISWIENIVPQIRVPLDGSGDSLLRIRRLMNQECWRCTVLIYLYMALCKASANDPRVVRAHNMFMRLFRSIQPGRNVDCCFGVSQVVVGVVTIKERDREMLRQRVLNVQEWATKGTTGDHFMLVLEDIWARTRDERRAAVWSDLGIARLRVTGR